MEILRRQQKKNSQATSNKKNDNKLKQLRALMMKLPVIDQLLLYRNHQEIQLICNDIWRNFHKSLDFRLLGQELYGESLKYFLINMFEHFRSVYFLADRLQENLYILDHAGIKALNNVQHCELIMSNHQRENGAEDDKLESVSNIRCDSMMPQWPLHALPEMLRNLRHLKVHCDVQVHFIEQFPLLELLVLHGNVAQSALTGIMDRCRHLKQLFIKFKRVPPQFKGIDNCARLQNISLPIRLFRQSRDQILSLPVLHLLELSGGQQVPELIIESIRHVIDMKSGAMKIIQLNCACFDSPSWIRDTALGRCNRLQGLVLNNCCFNEREINVLNMPRVFNYLVLRSCPDLKEYQLVDIIKICPTLSELYLIDCPHLSGNVLHDIYRIRCSEKLDYPMSIILSRCDAIGSDYQKSYDNYWFFKLSTLKLDRLVEESRPIVDIQMFFHKTKGASLMFNTCL